MENKILVETSARHVHVTQETLEVLFGAGHQLEVRKMLSQPGQFASTDKVTVIGYNKNVKGVHAYPVDGLIYYKEWY